jgi:hypothetical protein
MRAVYATSDPDSPLQNAVATAGLAAFGRDGIYSAA